MVLEIQVLIGDRQKNGNKICYQILSCQLINVTHDKFEFFNI